ncbi:MAG: 4-hydroxythreonine-4-phosphate dehydrogenase PdxA [Melioribacteraceae bacterium]|nr:4-hydroxythreonine-4-phosphate dehydrogenase PdxA [Melioribacteraceae bacterium]MCF8354862.1 4-hydroxythreonine-4-phosphate dehydrogenase PdxA [Melioribacteraceae bacterium]MCF8392969.1 4-hydroxythreonine-4-phosphate dehydrogenase PdxA [Melioribacteraceae bacterium]MCF8417288.1 4-hydroxythreonine-4-phosphate dehydrogenase PdxA [Melioribacteraceae bacterium]
MSTFVVTCGDINGVGPEIYLKSIHELSQKTNHNFILISPENVIQKAIVATGIDVHFNTVNSMSEINSVQKNVTLFNLGKVTINPGTATKESGLTAFEAIKTGYEIVSSGKGDALITAPISKSAFELAEVNYPGHTEMLAEFENTDDYLMTFHSEKLLCGLATIHEPIKNVPSLINQELLLRAITTARKMLENDLGYVDWSIGVLGLNPHAGENGRIGSEEIDFIKPAVDSFEDERIKGPFVPDAYFGNKLHEKFKFTLGMYHDQVLIPFKLMNFDSGVNYTAGLKIIRTSPDHGTAFDIAYRNLANHRSITNAVLLAERIISNRKVQK